MYDVNSLQAVWELEWPQFVYLACQAVALLNMDPMPKTLEVSHLPMAWLNAAAPENMDHMFTTCEVFHEPMG